MQNKRGKFKGMHPHNINLNYKTFHWRQRELDQLYVQTYRHFSNKIRQIKSLKPNIEHFQQNWFDIQYFHTEEPKNKIYQLKGIFSKKKKHRSEKSCELEDDKNEQVDWLSTKKIKSEKKNIINIVERKSLEKRAELKTKKNVLKKSIWNSPSQRIFDSQTVVDIILAANKVSIIPYPTNSYLYFNVFVDEGNNNEMIKSCIRKRSGWRVVEAHSVANMVWSQFYKFSLDLKPQRKIKEVAKIKEKSETQISGEKIEGITSKQEPFRTNPQNQNRKKDQLNPLSLQYYEKEVLKLCPEHEHLQKKTHHKIQIGPGLHFYNHFPNHYCISDKKNLLKNLTKFYVSKGQNVFSDLPYSIEIFDQSQVQLMRQKMSKMEGLWIVKPGENSNRGRGIVICKNEASVITQIGGKFKNSSKKNENILKESLLIQQYIEPLLYQKRKIDMRMFLLITCIKGKVRAYLYDEGYLRTSSRPFSLQNNSRYIHLTNDAIQYESPDYGKYEEGNKLSWKNFQRYIEEKNVDNVWEKLNKQLKRISANIVSACRTEIIKNSLRKSEQKQGKKSVSNLQIEEENIYFELFGLDFLIDKNYKVWLIEVNTNPALNTDCSRVVRNLIPRVIDNAFDIAVEPFVRLYRTYDTVKYENHFEAIFDEGWKR